MHWALNLVLFAALTAGGVGYRTSVIRSNAVIYFSDGHIGQVHVANYGDAFCPLNCKVQHRHRVHDIRWSCADGAACEHFTVLHVVYRGEENRLAALEKELSDTDLMASSHTTIGTAAATIIYHSPAARP